MVNFSWFYLTDILPGFLILTLGLYAFHKNMGDPLSRGFFFFTLSIWLVGILGSILGTATNIREAMLIDKVHLFFSYLIFVQFLHFCLAFYQRQEVTKPSFLLAIYVPYLALYFVAAFTKLINLDYFCTPFGYYSLPGPLNFLSYLVILAYMLGGIWLLFLAYRKTDNPFIKHQARLIAIGTIVPALIGSITDELLPLLGIKTVSLFMFSVYFMAVFLFVAITRYRLISISPNTAVPATTSAIPDALIATNTKGVIDYRNDLAGELFHDDLIKKNLFDLSEQKGLESKTRSFLVSNQEASRFEINLVKPDSTVFPVDIHCAKIRNQARNVVGLLWDIRDLSPDLELQQNILKKQAELKKRIKDLGHMNEMMKGRDERLAELKQEAAQLRAQPGG